MKNLLSFLASFCLIGSAASPIVACASPKLITQSIDDISMNSLSLPVNSKQNYEQLNTNETIQQAIIKKIQLSLNIKLISIEDFILSNNINQLSKNQEVGSLIMTVTANKDSKFIAGSFSFTVNLLALDLNNLTKKDFINEPNIVVNIEEKFNNLNTNNELETYLINLINKKFQIQLNISDFSNYFVLSNSGKDKTQTVNEQITFTLSSFPGNKGITNSTSFNLTLVKINITTAKLSSNFKLYFDTNKLISDLPTNTLLNREIQDDIRIAAGADSSMPVSINDYTITTSGPDKNEHQGASQKIHFIVDANLNTNFTGSFNFDLILQKLNLSDYKINNLQIPANPSQLCRELNTDPKIINQLISGIQEKFSVSLSSNDFSLSISKDGESQAIGMTKTMLFESKTSDANVDGTFTFVVELGKVSLKTLQLPSDFNIPTDPHGTYKDLLTDSYIQNEIINDVKKQFNTTITNKDFIISFADGNVVKPDDPQKVETEVSLTVSAAPTSILIQDSFTINQIYMKQISLKNYKSDGQFPDINKMKGDAAYKDLYNSPDIADFTKHAIDVANNEFGVHLLPDDFGLNIYAPTNKKMQDKQVVGDQISIIYTATDKVKDYFSVTQLIFNNIVIK